MAPVARQPLILTLSISCVGVVFPHIFLLNRRETAVMSNLTAVTSLEILARSVHPNATRLQLLGNRRQQSTPNPHNTAAPDQFLKLCHFRGFRGRGHHPTQKKLAGTQSWCYILFPRRFRCQGRQKQRNKFFPGPGERVSPKRHQTRTSPEKKTFLKASTMGVTVRRAGFLVGA